jgi:hypothetical protein
MPQGPEGYQECKMQTNGYSGAKQAEEGGAKTSFMARKTAELRILSMRRLAAAGEKVLQVISVDDWDGDDSLPDAVFSSTKTPSSGALPTAKNGKKWYRPLWFC